MSAERGWLRALAGLDERAEAGVLVTLAGVRGHAPREAGAKMVVSAGQSWGTVGGGNLEATAVARARALLAAGGAAPELLTLRLNPRAPNDYGRQCCGGEVTLLLEPLWPRPQIAVFGAGHVGLELARILARHPLTLHLVDSRAGQLSGARLAPLADAEATVRLHCPPLPEQALAELAPGALAVILTHDHAEDLALCDAALRRPDLGWVGLIGSAAKWSHFRSELLAAGHAEADLSRIVTPIGQPGPGGKSPAAVALSVAAQLLSLPELSPRAALPPAPPERTP